MQTERAEIARRIFKYPLIISILILFSSFCFKLYLDTSNYGLDLDCINKCDDIKFSCGLERIDVPLINSQEIKNVPIIKYLWIIYPENNRTNKRALDDFDMRDINQTLTKQTINCYYNSTTDIFHTECFCKNMVRIVELIIYLFMFVSFMLFLFFCDINIHL